MDDQVIKEFMSRIYEELKELKEGQLQNRESIEIIAVQTELLTTNMERLELRFDGLESRFDVLELRFDELESRFDVLESRFDGLESRFDVLESRFDRFEAELRNIKEIVIRIEIDHGAKIKALFNGHLQNKEKIEEHDRILKYLLRAKGFGGLPEK